MNDPRLDKLAAVIAGHSIGVKRGDRVLIEVTDAPDEVPVALIRAVRAAGGVPFVQLHRSLVGREMLAGATDEQCGMIAGFEMARMKKMDCYVSVRGSQNISESSDVPAEVMKRMTGAMRPVIDRRVRKTRWVVLRWPTPSMAQMAGMSTGRFEQFFFDVCTLDYRKLMPAMNALKRLMERTDRVEIRGPGTDLRFSIKGIPAVVCGGNYNLPDGEVFTAPVRDSVEGEIAFNAPSIYQGTSFDGVRLEFRKGKIVGASSNQPERLHRILDSDRGARFVGEFALGFNPKIREPMRDILFDEKIAGSFHFTPGQAYEVADNGNRSQVHWDLVSIQRLEHGGGEIRFDGKLVRKDGIFLPAALRPLNG